MERIRVPVRDVFNKRLMILFLLLLCLTAGMAGAETKVVLGTEVPTAGKKVVLEISNDGTDRFSYVLMHGSRTMGSADDVRERHQFTSVIELVFRDTCRRIEP